MKKLFGQEKYLKHSLRIARKALKRRLMRASVVRYQRRMTQGKTRQDARRFIDYYRMEHIPAPANCSFLENTEQVISFFNRLEDARARKRTTFVVLKKVEKLDYGAVSILLSIMSMFKHEKIGFNGDFPRVDEARKLLIESGFFEYINGGKSKEDPKYIPGRTNQIFTHLDKKVTPDLSLPIMAYASQTIWGEKRIDGGLHSILMELMQNTNNHASSNVPGEKHWWLSVNHEPATKKVGFAFVDHGVGVLASLGRKPPESKWNGWMEKVTSAFGAKSNEEFLDLLLAGKIHETVTKKSYRGKGLPNVKRMLDLNRISALYVVTNNVFGDVVNNKYRPLGINFSGTFFYWELRETNESRPWTI